MTPPFIVALDQGTTSSRSVLFGADFEKLDLEQREFTQHFPKPGWVEHDAGEIWQSQWETLRVLLRRNRLQAGDIAALGITNQRETVAAWDKFTGKPLARAIVWQDRRTAEYCRSLKKQGREPTVRKKTGLLLDPYFSATKMRWLLKNNPEVRRAAVEKRLAFGTMDSWLIFNLTGGKRHVIEVGNASRTMLMDIRSRAWDPALLRLFGIPASALPEILASDGDFGTVALSGLQGVKITGAAGDQQASLFGHRCFAPGSLKNTYGTGCFLLRNIGATYRAPPKGLLGTVAWTVRGETAYAHEGAVLVGGAAVQFLRDGLGIIAKASQSEELAAGLPSNEGVYFVPAFAGLGTPYWDPDARGLLIGLTRGTTRAHLCRAALESIAFQTLDMCEVFGSKIKILNVDGGASANAFLMQFQADILGTEVRANDNPEVTALGAAMLAALGAGLVRSPKELLKLNFPMRRYRPVMPKGKRLKLKAQWNQALQRSRNWMGALK